MSCVEGINRQEEVFEKYKSGDKGWIRKEFNFILKGK